MSCGRLERDINKAGWRGSNVRGGEEAELNREATPTCRDVTGPWGFTRTPVFAPDDVGFRELGSAGSDAWLTDGPAERAREGRTTAASVSLSTSRWLHRRRSLDITSISLVFCVCDRSEVDVTSDVRLTVCVLAATDPYNGEIPSSLRTMTRRKQNCPKRMKCEF